MEHYPDRYSRITTPIAAFTTNKRMSKTKLELTWIGKDKRPKLEPRILLEDPKLSYHAKFRRYSPSPPAPLPEALPLS